MSEVEIKLTELKKNCRTFILASTLVMIIIAYIYFSILNGANFNFLTNKYLAANNLFKYFIAVVYYLGLLSYITGIVFFSLSLYRSEKFYGESEFKESRNGALYTNKRHMFKAGLISSIVLISSLFVINVLISIIVFM